jgi:hypothetical protein
MTYLEEIKNKLNALGYSAIIRGNYLHFYTSQIEFITSQQSTSNYNASPLNNKPPSIIELKSSNSIELIYFPKGMLTYKKEFNNVDKAIEFIKKEIPLE